MEENNLTKSKLWHLSGCLSTFREVILHNVDTFIRMYAKLSQFQTQLEIQCSI